MDKIILQIFIFIFIIAFNLQSYSKSLTLVIPNGSDTTIIANPDDEFVKFNHKIRNNSFLSINIKTMVKVIQLTEGHLYSFCDPNQCYPFTNEDFEPSLPFSLGGMESTDEYFYIEIKPNNAAGKTILHITFYNEADKSDSIGYTLSIDVPTSINEKFLSENISIYPNPASEFLVFDFSNFEIDISNIKIFNNIGNILYLDEKISPQSIIHRKIDDLPQGLYFYEINLTNGKRINGKFIISR